MDKEIRLRLMAEPELLLSDRELMRAIIGAHEASLGENVIDIRGPAMAALETRLDRLEMTHETVMSAAYDNQAGMNMIHRAVVSLLEPADLDAFLDNMRGDLADILRVESLVLVMETTKDEVSEQGAPLQWVKPGTIARLRMAGRRSWRGDDILLRRAMPHDGNLHQTAIASEALLPLELGAERMPAILLLGSAEETRFSPAHGTDLLRFFSQVFRLALMDRLAR